MFRYAVKGLHGMNGLNHKEVIEMKIRCLNCMKEYECEFDICPHCGFEKGTPASDAYMLEPGTMLQNRYIIGTAIGAGGFAITYRAWDTKLDNMIAIKEYYPDNIVNRIYGKKEVILCGGHGIDKNFYQIGLKRFLEEAQNTVKFNEHENIVHVYNFFEENNTAYYTMEYMEGIDLSHYIKEHGGKISVEETTTILLSVINALKAVHGAGIIHRDISPDNIFICNNGKVKLFDFGAARFSEKENQVYDIVIKPGYAPPEQYELKSKQGTWTDIYALGATMYRAITGVLPTESTKRVEEGDTVKRPREIVPEIPLYIDACLTRAMSLEPAFRFKTVEQFEEVLLSKRKVRTESEEQRFRKKVRATTVTVASMVILFGAGLGYYLYHTKEVEANLEAATINVWILQKNGEDEGSLIEMYKEMSSEFAENYPEINISYTVIPESEYKDALAPVSETQEMPTLFTPYEGIENDFIGANPLDELLEIAQSDELYGWQQYENIFPDKQILPLGIEIPIKYMNSSNHVSGQTCDREQFINGNFGVYIGSSRDYRTIQQELIGMYTVESALDEVDMVLYTDCWSVNSHSTRSEILAAERLLYYWTGNQAQDIYHLQNEHSIPINKNTLKEYVSINVELEFIQEELEMATYGYMSEQEWRNLIGQKCEDTR